MYEKTDDQENAEKEYLKAVEIKPDYEFANHNLGALYFNISNQWEQKLNNLPPNETQKKNEYEAKSKEYLKKSIVYFEKSYEVSADKATKEQLKQLLTKLGDTEKAEKYK